MTRSPKQAIYRGFRLQCPACGVGRIMAGYLKINDHCPHCGEMLSHQRADDAPPYFTILIVAHIMVPMLLVVEELFAPPMWAEFVIWLPTITILTLLLLPRVKGALVGLQWATRMHGFGGTEDLPSKP